MPYTPTGRPVGRPKTKDYKTISLKMPQDLLDRVQTYARMHRQSVSELIRDGLEWRITEGDPRDLGVPAPQRAPSNDIWYSRNAEIYTDVRGESEYAEMLREIRTTLARQEAQLQALTEALEHHTMMSTPSEYSGNTKNEPRGQHSTVETALESDAWSTPQTVHEESSNTVLQKDIPAFDPAKFVLGPLCQKQHDYDGEGHSLRQRGGKHECVACKNARSRDFKQRQRQAKHQVQPT